MNSLHEDIKKILDYAVWAPSGDNSQPWRFEVNDNRIKVFNIPERDTSLYNYNQNASLVALGGLIENIKITSRYFGYTPEMTLFSDKLEGNLITTIVLTKNNATDDAFFPYVQERVSNRKPYKTGSLSEAQKTEILNASNTIQGITAVLIDDRNKIERLADAASVNEKVVLENKKLHEFLFHNITWTKEEDRERKGFFIKTLELKGPQKIAFRLFRHWPILTLFNKIGVSDLVARDNAKLYKQSGAFAAIVADDSSATSFLKSGMLMQRFWLTATKLKLGVQPITGILFLYHRIRTTTDHELQAHHAARVMEAYSTIENIFSTGGKPITMMFRVGYADKPSAKCLRREPEIKFL